MKIKHWFITLIVFFACSAVVSANSTFDKFTQNDGLSALKAGDDLGFEVIKRAELEEVRGEAIPAALYYLVLKAPTLSYAMQAAIAYHFPALLVKQIWNELH